jgi:hypothetical protein
MRGILQSAFAAQKFAVALEKVSPFVGPKIDIF